MNQKTEMEMSKKLSAIFILTVFLLGILIQPAFALDFGVYTAPTTTSYLNPDTGVTEDGGSQNVELGEGMCRSAVGDTALIEVDTDGNVYVTMRMLLYSNLSKIKIYTQSKKGGSYSAVSASITAENANSDSADFRFKVPSAGCNIKTSMYVAPMGRDVIFFWKVNSGSATSGNGDFVVNIDLNAKAKEVRQETAKVETETTTAAATPLIAQGSATPEPAKVEPAKETDKADDSKVVSVEKTEKNTTAKENKQASEPDTSAKVDMEKADDDANITEPTESLLGQVDSEQQDFQDKAIADENTTSLKETGGVADSNSSNIVFPIIILVIIVTVIGVGILIKKK